MRIDLCVVSPKGEHKFSCLVHLTTDEKSRLIEREFYEKYSAGRVPQGSHCELELLESIPITQGIHIHRNPNTGKDFVCWTGDLPTLELAEALFREWCVGTTYTLVYGKDFTPLTAGVKNFLEYMEKEHQIRISESMPSST